MLFSNRKFDTASVTSSIHMEKEKRKAKLEQLTADGDKGRDVKERESKKKKERREEKPVEEKHCKPGMFV